MNPLLPLVCVALSQSFDVAPAQSKLKLDAKNHREALYSALVAHYSSLQPGNAERLNMFETADARQAMKQLGADFLKRYPTDERALEVKFNIARATYEDGELVEAAALFKNFALANPKHKDAEAAAELALDSLDQMNDCAAVTTTGRAFLAEQRFSAGFLERTKKIVDATTAGDCNVRKWIEGGGQGDLLEPLLKTADELKGTPGGEKALQNAIALVTDRGDTTKRDELAQRLLTEYPRSEAASNLMQTLANDAANAARFSEATKKYEEIGARFNDAEAWLSAARLQSALGDSNGAVKAYEAAANLPGARKLDALVGQAQTLLAARETSRARATAELALKLDRTDARAAVVVAEVLAADPTSRPEAFVALLTPVTNAPRAGGEDTAKALFLFGDVLARKFEQLPVTPLEEKAAAMQQTQAVLLQAAEMGSAEWTVASLWRVATLAQHFANALETMAVEPAARAQLKANVQGLRSQADQLFERCATRALQLNVFSNAALGCRAKSVNVASPLRPLPAVKPVNVEALARAVDSKRDAASFEALGLAYLGAWHVKEARLLLSRSVELDGRRASALNALGYAALLDGDATSAFTAYTQALEADATFLKARANLGSLRCRFGDKAGARSELSQLSGTSVSGVDVDSEWSTCR
ncbi:MAG: outer membrane protein assembly factor BamD [Archangium sp.]